MARPRRTNLRPQKLSYIFKTERVEPNQLVVLLFELDTIFFQIVELHSSTKMYLKYGTLDLLIDNKKCSRPQLHLQLFKLFRTLFRIDDDQQDIFETRYFHDFSVCPDGLPFLSLRRQSRAMGQDRSKIE